MSSTVNTPKRFPFGSAPFSSVTERARAIREQRALESELKRKALDDAPAVPLWYLSPRPKAHMRTSSSNDDESKSNNHPATDVGALLEADVMREMGASPEMNSTGSKNHMYSPPNNTAVRSSSTSPVVEWSPALSGSASSSKADKRLASDNTNNTGSGSHASSSLDSALAEVREAAAAVLALLQASEGSASGDDDDEGRAQIQALLERAARIQQRVGGASVIDSVAVVTSAQSARVQRQQQISKASRAASSTPSFWVGLNGANTETDANVGMESEGSAAAGASSTDFAVGGELQQVHSPSIASALNFADSSASRAGAAAARGLKATITSCTSGSQSSSSGSRAKPASPSVRFHLPPQQQVYVYEPDHNGGSDTNHDAGVDDILGEDGNGSNTDLRDQLSPSADGPRSSSNEYEWDVNDSGGRNRGQLASDDLTLSTQPSAYSPLESGDSDGSHRDHRRYSDDDTRTPNHVLSPSDAWLEAVDFDADVIGTTVESLSDVTIVTPTNTISGGQKSVQQTSPPQSAPAEESASSFSSAASHAPLLPASPTGGSSVATGRSGRSGSGSFGILSPLSAGAGSVLSPVSASASPAAGASAYSPSPSAAAAGAHTSGGYQSPSDLEHNRSSPAAAASALHAVSAVSSSPQSQASGQSSPANAEVNGSLTVGYVSPFEQREMGRMGLLPAVEEIQRALHEAAPASSVDVGCSPIRDADVVPGAYSHASPLSPLSAAAASAPMQHSLPTEDYERYPSFTVDSAVQTDRLMLPQAPSWTLSAVLPKSPAAAITVPDAISSPSGKTATIAAGSKLQLSAVPQRMADVPAGAQSAAPECGRGRKPSISEVAQRARMRSSSAAAAAAATLATATNSPPHYSAGSALAGRHQLELAIPAEPSKPVDRLQVKSASEAGLPASVAVASAPVAAPAPLGQSVALPAQLQSRATLPQMDTAHVTPSSTRHIVTSDASEPAIKDVGAYLRSFSGPADDRERWLFAQRAAATAAASASHAAASSSAAAAGGRQDLLPVAASSTAQYGSVVHHSHELSAATTTPVVVANLAAGRPAAASAALPLREQQQPASSEQQQTSSCDPHLTALASSNVRAGLAAGAPPPPIISLTREGKPVTAQPSLLGFELSSRHLISAADPFSRLQQPASSAASTPLAVSAAVAHNSYFPSSATAAQSAIARPLSAPAGLGASHHRAPLPSQPSDYAAKLRAVPPPSVLDSVDSSLLSSIGPPPDTDATASLELGLSQLLQETSSSSSDVPSPADAGFGISYAPYFSHSPFHIGAASAAAAVAECQPDGPPPREALQRAFGALRALAGVVRTFAEDDGASGIAS